MLWELGFGGLSSEENSKGLGLKPGKSRLKGTGPGDATIHGGERILDVGARNWGMDDVTKML